MLMQFLAVKISEIDENYLSEQLLAQKISTIFSISLLSFYTTIALQALILGLDIISL
jgi:hypothetical protein